MNGNMATTVDLSDNVFTINGSDSGSSTVNIVKENTSSPWNATGFKLQNTTLGFICPDLGTGNNSFNGSMGDMTPLEEFSMNYAKLHGYISVCVCLFGMMANTANIVVLTRKNMVTSTNYILMWLAVADLFTMVSYFPFAMHFYILKDERLPFPMTLGYGWVCFLMFHASFSIVCHTVAIWLTIGLATFRFVFIWFPTRGGMLCNMRRAKQVVVVVIVFTLIICIPNYMSNEIVTYECVPRMNTYLGENIYSLEVRKQGAFEVISSVNYWVQALLIKLIPCVLLTLLTLLLITAMHKAYKRRMALKNQGRKDESDKHGEHNRTTMMLLAVVVLFVMTELPQGILTILSNSIDDFFERVYMPLGDLLDIVALCNNAINFVLYCSMSKIFRTTFFKTFCRCLPERRPGWRKLGVVTAQKNDKMQKGMSDKNGCSTTTTTTHV